MKWLIAALFLAAASEATSGPLPELHDELHGVTDLFMQARYGERPVEPDQLARVQALWHSLRALLRRAPRAKP